MKVIETHMQGKIDLKQCEDAYVVSDDFIAVIDGVTSKSDFTYQEKTTGKIAAEIVKDVLLNMSRQAEIDYILESVNRRFVEFYQTVNFPYNKKEKGLQAVCVIYSDYFRTIWMIGDCQVLVDGVLHAATKKSDDILSQMRSLILHILKEDPQKDWKEAQREARSIIEPWILKSNQFANTHKDVFGYAMINGEQIPKTLIQNIVLDENQHEIVLASDGYPKVKNTLKESEEYLAGILEKDPACYCIYPSTKGVLEKQTSFDDRTYIRFLI